MKNNIQIKSKIICKVCGGYCYEGFAFRNEDLYASANEFGMVTVFSQAGRAKLQKVLKCEDCGHSFTQSLADR